jgi:hypothetical protein
MALHGTSCPRETEVAKILNFQRLEFLISNAKCDGEAFIVVVLYFCSLKPIAPAGLVQQT